MNELLRKISEWIAGFEADWEEFSTATEKRVRLAEASLYRRVFAQLLPALNITEGRIKATVGNMAKANIIERVFDDFGRDEFADIVRAYSDKMLEIPGRNAQYYLLTGQDRAKVERLANDLGRIRAMLGIDADGNPARDGYLYRFGRTDAVRDRLKNYALTGIATGQGAEAFERGLKSLIQGGGDVDGALLSYWRQFAFDTYNRVREVDNAHQADALGLKWFVYQGGLIKTSRRFCIKKNGKVFSTEEAERDWPNDPDLINKKNRASYRPLIDRGRNNCRHFLMYISAERAEQLKKRQ